MRGSGPVSTEAVMPIYEYVCVSCKKQFSKVELISKHDPKNVKCPKCMSKRVERRWTSVSVTTSTKS